MWRRQVKGDAASMDRVQAAACNPALLLPAARVLLRSLQLSASLPGGAPGSVLLVTDVNALVDLIEVRLHPQLPRAAVRPPSSK